MPRIVFAPKFPKPLVDVLMEMKPAGFDLTVAAGEGPEFFSAVKGADYFMGFARNPLGPEFYAAAPNMKLVQLISAGYNTVDLAAARKAGVPVANNGGANSVAVAEHAMMLILATLKKLHWQHNNVTAGKWRVGDFAETRLYELEGKTVGIVGLGNIGKKVARRLRGFECKIVYYDIIRLPEHEEDALGVRYVLLDELLATADVVTLHTPLTSVTQNMISDRQLELMNPTGIAPTSVRASSISPKCVKPWVMPTMANTRATGISPTNLRATLRSSSAGDSVCTYSSVLAHTFFM